MENIKEELESYMEDLYIPKKQNYKFEVFTDSDNFVGIVNNETQLLGLRASIKFKKLPKNRYYYIVTNDNREYKINSEGTLEGKFYLKHGYMSMTEVYLNALLDMKKNSSMNDILQHKKNKK